MNISNINNIKSTISPVANLHLNTEQVNKPSFEEYLKNSLQDVNSLQIESDKQSSLLATGQVENVHDVMIAGAKAKTSLDLTMAVRNKVVEAYKEIMRMQV